MSKQTDFFAKYKNLAIETQNLFGVPASITLAQAALESGWGLSGLTVRSNNFFGIKADSTWKGERDTATTKEFVNGGYITIQSNFRKYATAQDGFNDHAKFLLKFSRYASLFKLPVTDYKGWANGLQSAGYATDPTYASKLINMIQQYNLLQYDQEAAKKKIIKPLITCVVSVGLCLGVAYYKKWLNEPKKIVLTVLVGVAIGLTIHSVKTFIQKK